MHRVLIGHSLYTKHHCEGIKKAVVPMTVGTTLLINRNLLLLIQRDQIKAGTRQLLPMSKVQMMTLKVLTVQCKSSTRELLIE